jgi:hypothetical protein
MIPIDLPDSASHRMDLIEEPQREKSDVPLKGDATGDPISWPAAGASRRRDGERKGEVVSRRSVDRLDNASTTIGTIAREHRRGEERRQCGRGHYTIDLVIDIQETAGRSSAWSTCVTVAGEWLGREFACRTLGGLGSCRARNP